MDEICVNVRKEPILQEVNNEDLPWEANKNKETHLNISVRRVNNFWTTSQRAFFNVRVISSLRDIIWQLAVEKYFRANKNKKKRTYGNKVLKIENGSFTPVVFAANGGMGK